MDTETQVAELRKCPRCENELPLTSFRLIKSVSGPQVYTTYCKDCSRQYQREYRKNGGRVRYNKIKVPDVVEVVVPEKDSVLLPLNATDRSQIRQEMSSMLKNNVELIAQREELQVKTEHLDSEKELLKQELNSLRIEFDKLKLSIPTVNRVDVMPKQTAMREMLYHILQGGYDPEVDPIEYINDARAIIEELYK